MSSLADNVPTVLTQDLNTIPRLCADTDIMPEQESAGLALVELYKTNRWIILCAQMQSGKTGTLLLVACELLRLQLVDNVYIISGNTETALREQMKREINAFGRKYRQFVCKHYPTQYNVENLWGDIESHIFVKWGKDLEKQTVPTTRSLYIIDESHAAQNKGMRPHKFLKAMGIEANGDERLLANANAMVLSVSATPFSEISNDHYGENKWKGRVHLNVSDAYIGVEKMLDTGIIQLVRTTDFNAILMSKLRNILTYCPAYCIIRTKDKKNVHNIITCIESDAITVGAFEYKTYDSSSKINNLENLDILKNAPYRPTIIFIKGKCRMGQVLHTEHIALCVETALDTKTDASLQGLVGRMCGYKKHHPHACILIPDPHGKKKEELNLYVQFVNGSNVIPTKGMNLIASSITKEEPETYPIIPIRLRIQRGDYNMLTEGLHISNPSRSSIIASIIAAMRDPSYIKANYNGEVQTREIVQRFNNDDTIHISVHLIKKAKNDSLAQRISKAMKDKIPSKLGSSNGIRPDGKTKDGKWAVNAFVFNCDITCANDYIIKQGDIYLDMRTTQPSDNVNTFIQIVRTTGREIFSQPPNKKNSIPMHESPTPVLISQAEVNTSEATTTSEDTPPNDTLNTITSEDTHLNDTPLNTITSEDANLELITSDTLDATPLNSTALDIITLDATPPDKITFPRFSYCDFPVGAIKGYQSTNPNAKDELNDLFANHIPHHERAVVVVLDHIEFKTARRLVRAGINPSRIYIPQYDPATYRGMITDPIFAACVRLQTLKSLLTTLKDNQEPVAGVYADLTCAYPNGRDHLNIIRQVALIPGAVIGLTISLRNPEGSDFVHSDTVNMIEDIYKEFKPYKNLVREYAGRSAAYVYGVKTTMVTFMIKMA